MIKSRALLRLECGHKPENLITFSGLCPQSSLKHTFSEERKTISCENVDVKRLRNASIYTRKKALKRFISRQGAPEGMGSAKAFFADMVRGTDSDPHHQPFLKRCAAISLVTQAFMD